MSTDRIPGRGAPADPAGVPADAEPCRNCREPVRLTEEEMRQVFGGLTGIRGVKLADAETVRARLAVCEACSSLQAGTTCMHCGCVVQARAKLLHAACPYPFQPKW